MIVAGDSASDGEPGGNEDGSVSVLLVIRAQVSVAILVRRGVASIENDWSAELAQLPANHGDRARWECVHAVGRGGNRDVLILSRSVAILHKSYRSNE